jgi:putative tryptophan/tyrosine transport system substrate-binding protein
MERTRRVGKKKSGERMKDLFKRTNKIIKCNLAGSRRISYSLIVACLVAFSMYELRAGETSKKILILNSDISVSNYSQAHTGFESKLTIPNDEIDLGNKWMDETKIKNTIHTMNPDIIYCIGSKAYLLAYELAENKKIVFSSIVNWRRLPLGKKTYGVAAELLPSMQLTLYRYLFPNINKIGILYSTDYNKEWLEIAVKSAKEIGIEIIKKSISNQDDIKSALEKLLPMVDALWLTPDPVVISKLESVEQIFKQSDRAGKPVFAYSEAFADLGATLIISADIPTTGIQAAGIALDLLSNQKVTERVQTPAGSHITLNLKNVEKYKIKLNEEALDSVNQIIQ